MQLIAFAFAALHLFLIFATSTAAVASRMTNDCSAFLIPSQVAGGGAAVRRQGSSKEDMPRPAKKRDGSIHVASMLSPSQAMPSSWGGVQRSSSRRIQRRRDTSLHAATIVSTKSANDVTVSNNESDAGDEVVYSPANGHRAAAVVSDDNNSTASTNSTNSGRRERKARKKHRMTGNIPDVFWRAVPMEHLRRHPNFEPLPHPDTIKELNSLEDVRLFRQDSWQWDALHSGRCTTSQATAALGLLEPQAGNVLGIPRSLQKGAVGAYHRLSKPALRTLEDMNEVLCTGEGNCPPELEELDYPVWDSKRTTRFRGAKNFAALYLPRIKKTDLDRRRHLMKNYYTDDSSRWLARMQWGNAQEPTSILTALNYFSKAVPGTMIREVGMCGAGLDINSTSSDGTGLIVGATPDAVIHYPNGTLEALEVKNHCPFVPLYWGSRRKAANAPNGKDLFRIRESTVHMDVPPAYVPQIMMEMHSVGPQCRSAIMVRQTATKGAVILRLQRDDEWIEEMIYWLNQFMEKFVNEEVSPPPNVFWADGEYSGGERYRAFVNRTKEISENAELVCTVPHGEIQRVVATRRFQIPLFLD